MKDMLPSAFIATLSLLSFGYSLARAYALFASPEPIINATLDADVRRAQRTVAAARSVFFGPNMAL